jgi:2',3'-cyclic-nucleotide 2'-phosphodiesterase (5'-nucleotidase family)
MGENGAVMSKRYVRLTLAMGLLVSSLWWPGCHAPERELVLLFSNDTHGTFQPQKIKDGDTVRLVGGMEAASHHINLIRAREENVLLIDTGDIMTGTLAATLPFEGAMGGAMPEFLNLLGYDVRAHGNHAFDLGQDNVKAIERISDMPVVMANIVFGETGELFAPEPFAILKTGGIRVGVIGVMEEFFLGEVLPDRVEGLDILPIVPTLQRWMPELRRKSDLVVALVHSKFYDGQRVAREVPDVDVVLVASEDGLFEEINGTPVKSTRGHQKTLGFLKLRLQRGRILDYEESLIWLWADIDLSPSPEVTALVRKVEASIEEEYERIIGDAGFDYKCPGYESIENSLGNWITDVMRWKTGAQIGLLNSGGIRADIYSGPISVRSLHEVSPFQNTLVVFDVSGRELRQIFETDIERDRDRIQVSGMRYTYHSRETLPQGKRVDFLAVGKDEVIRDGRLLLPDAVFSVVSNDYVIGQARRKYFGFEVEEAKMTGFHLTQVMVEWLQENRVLKCSLEDRIVELKSVRTR